MRPTATLGVLLLLTWLVTLPACEDPFVDPTVQPPLIVNEPSVVPGEEAQLGSNEVTNISVTFNRTLTSVDEALFRMFPAPSATGDLTLTGSGRNVTWFQVAPSVDSRVQRLFVDGPTMRDPFLRTWYTGTPTPQGRFSGQITSPSNAPGEASDAVVFAIDVFSGFNPLDPATFVQVEPLAVSLPADISKAETEAPYVMSKLPDRSNYLVVAVLDTNHDAIYDPTDDWWGFFGDQLSNDPEVVMARAGFDSVATNVDIILVPPRGE